MTSRYALLAVALAAGEARADLILVSGNNMDSTGPLPGILTSLGYSSTFVAPSSFNTATIHFSGVKAGWLDGYSAFTNLRSSDLISFMNNGGNVFVQNPGFGTQPLSAYPFGSELTNVFASGETVRILDFSSPVGANRAL